MRMRELERERERPKWKGEEIGRILKTKRMKQLSLPVSYMTEFEAQGLEMYVKFPLDIVMEDCGDYYTNVDPPSRQ